MTIDFLSLKPVQALIATYFFRNRHVLLMLPRQEGKTELGVRLLHAMLEESAAYQEYRSGIFLSKSKPAGAKATREKFKRLFDENDYEVNTQQVYSKSFQSSVIWMDSVDKQPNKLRGGSYHLVHWSEVAFSQFDLGVTVQHVMELIIQPTQRATNGYSFLESTPNGKNGWWDLWENYKALELHRIKLSLSQLVEMGLCPREEYDSIQRKTTRLGFLQEYECEFVTFQGLVFEEFKDHHIWLDMPGPQHWQKVVIGIDWGWNPSATCVLFGYVLHGRMCIFDEIYGLEMRLDEVEKQIKARLALWSIEKCAAVADHDPRSVNELNMAEIPCTNAEKINVRGVRMEIKTKLHRDELYFHPRCIYTIRDLQSMVWDDKAGKNGEVQDKLCTWGHFDGEAALRYLIRELGKAENDKPEENPHNYDSGSAAVWAREQEIK